jgi:hypothetical protein
MNSSPNQPGLRAGSHPARAARARRGDARGRPGQAGSPESARPGRLARAVPWRAGACRGRPGCDGGRALRPARYNLPRPWACRSAVQRGRRWSARAPDQVSAHHAGSSRSALRRMSRWRPATPIVVPGVKAQFKATFPVKPAVAVACCRGRLAELGADCRTHPQHPVPAIGTPRPPPLGALLAPPERPLRLVPALVRASSWGDSCPAVSAPSGPSWVPRRIRARPPSRPPRRSCTGPRAAEVHPRQDSCLSGPFARLVHASAATRPDSRRPLAHIPLAAAVNFVPLPRVTRTIRAVPCRMETN